MLSFLILCGILYGAAAVVSSAPDAVCAASAPVLNICSQSSYLCYLYDYYPLYCLCCLYRCVLSLCPDSSCCLLAFQSPPLLQQLLLYGTNADHRLRSTLLLSAYAKIEHLATRKRQDTALPVPSTLQHICHPSQEALRAIPAPQSFPVQADKSSLPAAS